MNRKLLFLVLWVMAAFVPTMANELTVYEGTSTSNYVPAYVYYWDDFTRAQTVIPAADLEYMAGGTISAIKFYTTSSNIPYTSAAVADVYLMEVDYTTISAFEPKASGTMVYQGTFDFVAEGNGGVVTITFNEPYAYNGGNLLIGIENTTDAQYKNINFYGQSVTGASISGYSSSSLDGITPSQRNFIPKTTFTYTPGEAPVYYKPTDVAVSDITPNTAKVTWTPGSTETAWNVEYKKAADEEWTAEAVTGTPEITLDALQNNTAYEVRVQANYGDDNLSSWTTPVSFTTLRCDDMGYITYSLTDSYGDGWNGASISVVDAATNEVIQTLTVPSANNSATGTIGICMGETYNFVWNSGSYDSECSMNITDPFGEEIYSGGASTGQFASYTYQIITNPTPKNLAVDEITQTSAQASWTGEAEAYNLRYRTKATSEKFFEEGFENGLGSWTIVDNDNDGSSWDLMKMTNYTMGGVQMTTADGGDYALASTSIDANYNYITCDNWAISPQVDLKGTLKFFVSDLGAEYVEHFSVYVSTTGTDVSNFTALGENLSTPGGLNNWAEQSYDLSAYEGQQGYIAIRHQGSGTGGYYLFLDAVSINGADIPEGEWVVMENVASPVTMEGLASSTEYEVQVQAIFEEENSDWTASVDFTTLGYDIVPEGLEITEVTATTATAEWEGVQEAYNLRYRAIETVADFEDSTMGEWTAIDADGDGYNWVLGSACGGIYLAAGGSLAGSGHTPNDLVTSGSFSNVSGVGALTPDNYLVSPKVKLGGKISFWAKGQDASYAAEVFGVAVSLAGNTDAADFTMVGEQKTATGDWVEYTFDLSEFAGQEGYVAIRHYDCTDQFMFDVDDIVITSAGSEWTVAENVTSPYTIEGLTPETNYEAQIQAIYEAKAVTEWSASAYFTTLEAEEETGIEELYLVGSFNSWDQTEEGGRIAFELADGEFTATTDLEAGAEFKLITPLANPTEDEQWQWFGGQDDNQVGYFLINNDLLDQGISLVEGANFRIEEGGTYNFVVTEQRGLNAPLVMTVSKATITAITDLNSDNSDNTWYNIQGMKLQGVPTVPGIYINAGKKVVVK